MELIKAFAYRRVSGQSQKDKDGFERQRLAIEQYAASEGIEVVGWYEDVQTGKDEWEARPGWSQMVGALNGVRTIIVENLSRVARKVLVQELILSDLGKREVSLITAGGDDSSDDDPERVCFRQMLAVFAQYERASIVMKLRGARERMREETGRCEGRKKFGYREGEDAVIARMKELHATGMTAADIARTLNAEGYRTRTGKEWIQPTVGRMVKQGL